MIYSNVGEFGTLLWSRIGNKTYMH